MLHLNQASRQNHANAVSLPLIWYKVALCRWACCREELEIWSCHCQCWSTIVSKREQLSLSWPRTILTLAESHWAVSNLSFYLSRRLLLSYSSFHHIRSLHQTTAGDCMGLKYNSSFRDFAFHLHTNTIGPIITAQKLLRAGLVSGTIVFMSSDSGSATKFLEMEDG